MYRTDQAYESGLDAVEPFADRALQAYGRGAGTLDWEGTAGTIEWTNFPPRRSDGVFLPNITGTIHLTGSSNPILYRMRGISLHPDDAGHRLFAGPVRWFTDDPDLLWLNDRWGYEEGQISIETLRFVTTVHLLEPEPVLG